MAEPQPAPTRRDSLDVPALGPPPRKSSASAVDSVDSPPLLLLEDASNPGRLEPGPGSRRGSPTLAVPPRPGLSSRPGSGGRGSTASAGSSRSGSTSPRRPLPAAASQSKVILHVLCVQFHHRYGPQVEYAFPPLPPVSPKQASSSHGRDPASDARSSTSNNPSPTPPGGEGTELPEEWSFLPFLCLPDGAHLSDEEYIYFHLPPVADPRWTHPYGDKTLFGLACYNQIDVNALTHKTPDMTRSSVQKAVVVLAADPVLGAVKNKLGLVTQAFFAQRDFSKLEILQTLYENLSISIRGAIADSQMLMSISLQDLVHTFKHKTLVLFKLLLLERKVLFFGAHVERIARYQYSLVSLIPYLLRSMYGSGAPNLGFLGMPPHPEEGEEHAERRMEAQRSGLPLQLFGKGSFFQPYLPLQQVDVIKAPGTRAFLIGSTNSIFTHHKGWDFDVIVHCDTGTIDILTSGLGSALALTTPDKKFMEEIVKPVLFKWRSEEDVEMNQSIGYEGSDEDIRARFEAYLESMLVCVKVTNEGGHITRDEEGKERRRDLLSDFGLPFLRAWQATSNYAAWNEETIGGDLLASHPTALGHPFQGHTVFSNLSNAMSARFSELSKTMAPLQSNLSKAVVNVEASLTRTLEETMLGASGGEAPAPPPPAKSPGATTTTTTISMTTTTTTSSTGTGAAGNLFSNMSNFFAQRRKEWGATAATAPSAATSTPTTATGTQVQGTSSSGLTSLSNSLPSSTAVSPTTSPRPVRSSGTQPPDMLESMEDLPPLPGVAGDGPRTMPAAPTGVERDPSRQSVGWEVLPPGAAQGAGYHAVPGPSTASVASLVSSPPEGDGHAPPLRPGTGRDAAAAAAAVTSSGTHGDEWEVVAAPATHRPPAE